MIQLQIPPFISVTRLHAAHHTKKHPPVEISEADAQSTVIELYSLSSYEPTESTTLSGKETSHASSTY